MNFGFKQAKALREAEEQIKKKLYDYRNERKAKETVKTAKPFNKDDLFQK